jgi:L-lactate dehydrogenase complex protein LldG
MSARDTILAAIRSASVQASRPAAPYTIQHILPRLDHDLVGRFVERIRARSATVTRLSRRDEVGAAVLAFLDAHGLPARLVLAPALAGLTWPESLERRCGPARAEDEVSVTPCFAAIAESGSLVLLSGPETPTTLNFVPANHIVVVETSQLVAHPEDVWTRLRARPGGLPRTVNVISGPSRTADVEQTIQLGAHGPRRLHLLLIGETPGRQEGSDQVQ